MPDSALVAQQVSGQELDVVAVAAVLAARESEPGVAVVLLARADFALVPEQDDAAMSD